MQKYYCVLSLTCADGRTEAAITDAVIAPEKPKNTHICAGRVIIHMEWFESLQEAEETVKEIRAA